MTQLSDFITKWNGKQLQVLPDSIKNKQGQCFDVPVAWCDLLGIPHYPGNPSPFPYQFAYQIYLNFGTWQAQYFTQVVNGLFNSPGAGDIVVFKPGFNGGPGHVVLATGPNSFWGFEAFSENDPLGSNCAIKTYNYNLYQANGIYGWLHPKCLDKIGVLQFWQACNDKRETKITDTDYRNWERDFSKTVDTSKYST